jgi:hypothetical protein
MPHAIIRGKNGRRREVDFGDAPVRVEIYASDETIEIFVEADFETLPEERRRFALLNIPRHLFSEATAATARRAIGRRRATLPSSRVLGMLHSLSISPISTYCARGDERVEPDRRQRQSANPPRQHDRRHARAHRATRHPERARSRRVLRPRSMISRFPTRLKRKIAQALL